MHVRRAAACVVAREKARDTDCQLALSRPPLRLCPPDHMWRHLPGHLLDSRGSVDHLEKRGQLRGPCDRAGWWCEAQGAAAVLLSLRAGPPPFRVLALLRLPVRLFFLVGM